MNNLSLPEVSHLIDTANALRWQPEPSHSAVEAAGRCAEQQLETLFSTNHTLAVYGSLAPGRSNYHIVAPLGGEWTEGLVEGDLVPVGWGVALGYPAFRPRAGGTAVAVHVLISPLLATAWPGLDRFEGAEYQRILIPVFSPGPADERRLVTVANLYATVEARLACE